MKGQALIDTIVAKASHLSKTRRQFLTGPPVRSYPYAVFKCSSPDQFPPTGSPHSDQYCEHTMRLHFENYIDFATINQCLIQQYGSGHFILALDVSYLPKSGKKTPGLGHFWSGSAQQSLWGLEISLLSVIDVEHRTAWHLDAVQTPDKAQRTAKDISLLDHYAPVVVWQCCTSQLLSAYLAVDAYFAKAGFVDRITRQTTLHIISLLRQDARLRYHYRGSKTAGKGRPRQFAGPVDFTQLDRIGGSIRLLRSELSG